LRRLQAESEQRQKRNIAAIQTIFANLAAAFTAAADNPAKVLTFIGYITLFFAAVYTAREAARLCRILLEAALGKPKLVRETTRMSLPRTLLNNLLFLGRRANINTKKTVEETFLFSWAKMSPKGVLLFVDEAEAFLGSRSKYSMSECAHNALNAILYNTGSERMDFMLILATNRYGMTAVDERLRNSFISNAFSSTSLQHNSMT